MMPSSTIVLSNGTYRLYGDHVQTFHSLPVATYAINFDVLKGYSLRTVEPLSAGTETVYGNHQQRVDRILRAYQDMDRSLGVLLSGDKGMGKSLLARMLAHQARERLHLPTILVQTATQGLVTFLDELGEVFLLFDEFEKNFRTDDDHDSQIEFLPLFDGVSMTKRLYALSVNELHYLSKFLVNRPGRLHYHLRFDYPDVDIVESYLRDQIPTIPHTEMRKIIDFSRKYQLNFDHLRAIVFELRHGESFDEVIGELNIKRTGSFYQEVRFLLTWADGKTDRMMGDIDYFDQDTRQSVSDHQLGMRIHFRMSDAVAHEQGFFLPEKSYQITDLRDSSAHDESDILDDLGIPTTPQHQGSRVLKSVHFTFPRARSIDF